MCNSESESEGANFCLQGLLYLYNRSLEDIPIAYTSISEALQKLFLVFLRLSYSFV